MNRRLPLLVGGFLSGLGILLGTIGMIAFSWRLLPWLTVERWPTAMATIVDAREESTSGRGGVRSYRPWLVYHYTFGNTAHRGEGFDVAGHYSSDRPGVRQILDTHPVGARVSVFVNPDDHAESYVARGGTGGLIILLLPPLFFVLGLCGAGITLAGAMGAFAPESNHLLARGQRAMAAWFFRGQTMRILVFGSFGSVIAALLVFGEVFTAVPGWV